MLFRSGIWFWVLVGLGMALMRMEARPNDGPGRIGIPLEFPRRPGRPRPAEATAG